MASDGVGCSTQHVHAKPIPGPHAIARTHSRSKTIVPRTSISDTSLFAPNQHVPRSNSRTANDTQCLVKRAQSVHAPASKTLTASPSVPPTLVESAYTSFPHDFSWFAYLLPGGKLEALKDTGVSIMNAVALQKNNVLLLAE